MQQQLQEEKLIFYSVIRWILLATLVGVLAGLFTTFFLKILEWGGGIPNEFPWYYWTLPLVFVFNIALVKYIAPDAAGHGTEKVIQAVHQQSGKIKAAVIPIKLVATILTIFAGGSGGREGPSAQMGAGIASLTADLFKFSDADRKKLVICGISAGFAAIFGTPIAGAIFGIEVLFVGMMLYDVLLPSFIAGMAAFQVTQLFGVVHFHQEIHFVPTLDQWFMLEVILSGLIFGLVALLMIEILNRTHAFAHQLKIWEPLKGIIGGGAILILALLLGKQTLGLGTDVIKQALSGTMIVWYAFLVKIAVTALTLSFGGSGGVVTPLFFIGATAGALFGHLIGADVATFAVIGFIAVLGGATNAPIAVSIMALEMFGSQLAPYAAVACIISYLITGNRSVYPTQILAMKKAEFLDVELGKTLEELENKFDDKNLIDSNDHKK